MKNFALLIITLISSSALAVAQNDKGETLRALNPATYRKVRAYDRVVPADQPWQQAMEKDLVAIW